MDAGVDELQHVLVLRDDHRIELPASRPVHQRSDHIVCLEAYRTVATSSHALEHHGT